LEAAAFAPVSRATVAALSPLDELTVTVCPARRAEVARALPTLPAPMMAMFMGASWMIVYLREMYPETAV
jgi:hypothetical protein